MDLADLKKSALPVTLKFGRAATGKIIRPVAVFAAIAATSLGIVFSVATRSFALWDTLKDVPYLRGRSEAQRFGSYSVIDFIEMTKGSAAGAVDVAAGKVSEPEYRVAPLPLLPPKEDMGEFLNSLDDETRKLFLDLMQRRGIKLPQHSGSQIPEGPPRSSVDNIPR